MGRPVTTGKTKQKLTLTVSAEVREYLDILSQNKGISVSQMLSDYAIREYKRLVKSQEKTGA